MWFTRRSRMFHAVSIPMQCTGASRRRTPVVLRSVNWHAPALRPKSSLRGYALPSGHQFRCYHVTKGNKHHYIAVLESSRVDRHLALLRPYVEDRMAKGCNDDLVSIITFGVSASIYCEGKAIADFTVAVEEELRKDKQEGALAGLRAALRLAHELHERCCRAIPEGERGRLCLSCRSEGHNE